jgi:hypothetical protein
MRSGISGRRSTCQDSQPWAEKKLKITSADYRNTTPAWARPNPLPASRSTAYRNTATKRGESGEASGSPALRRTRAPCGRPQAGVDLRQPDPRCPLGGPQRRIRLAGQQRPDLADPLVDDLGDPRPYRQHAAGLGWGATHRLAVPGRRPP